MILLNQLIVCIQKGMLEVTADDITEQGAVAIDAGHAPNGKQSSIGSFFRQMNADGIIRSTGRVIKSQAPKRKGGMIQVWEVTPKGQRLYGNGQDTARPTSRVRRPARRQPQGDVPVADVPLHDERRIVRGRVSRPGRQRPAGGGAGPHGG